MRVLPASLAMSRRSRILLAASLLTLALCSSVGYFLNEQRTRSAPPAPERGEPRGLTPRGELPAAVPTPAPSESLLARSREVAPQGLAEAVSPLAYAQGWDGPMPPAMEAFREWTLAYVDAESAMDQALLELEGVALARARRGEMLALIRTDPELALALTVPAALRALLPVSVDSLLEERVSGRGDYEILMAVQPLGARTPESEIRRVTIAGRSFEAHVYGRRSRQTSQQGASLHGIALEACMALHESPVRVLEPGEIVPFGVAAARCPVSGEPTAAIPALAAVNGRVSSVVEVDGRPWQLASPGLVDALEAKLIEAEDLAGPSVPEVMAGADLQPLAPDSWTTGAKSLLIIRVDFSDKPGEPFAYQTTLDLMNNSVSPYYDAISYGAASINATVTSKTYRMPQTAAAYATGNLTSQLYADATTAAGADYTVADYQHVMILFTRLNSIAGSQFTWAGLGSVGGGTTWINGYYDLRVTAHELGHNFGLFHANLWQVGDGNPASASGSSTEYADPFDIMGGGNTDARHHMNPWFKNRMGWLPDSAVRPVTATGTYRVTRYDAKASPLDQTLALNVFCDGRRTYWIGLRQNFTATPSLFNGAYVVWGFGSNQASQLLDMTTPGTNANDSGLPIGVTFTDAAHGISIQPLSKGGAAPAEFLDVQVTVGQPSSPFVVGWGGSQAVSGLTTEVTGVRAVASGAQHGLALKTDGTVTAWGNNTYGQTSVPVGLSGVIGISARGNVSGAVTSTGSVAVWGDGTAGQTTVPSGLGGVIAISIGGDHALALKGDGTVVAWGNNSSGESTVPAGLSGVVAITAGNNTSYAVRSNGTVTRWGSAVGTIPSGLSGVVAVAAGSQHALALKSDGTVVAWGGNTYGQATVPAGLTDVLAITAGAFHSVALKSDGTAVVWGYDSIANSTPPALSRVSSIAANDSGTLAVIGSSILSSPTFIEQPVDRVVANGQSAQFAVTASGSSVLDYQWQRMAAGASTWTDVVNSAPYSGVTSATLTISATTGAMNGDQFRCIVSYDGASPVSSAAALLTVTTPPSIDTQPASTSGTAGGALTLSVGASGSGTLSYQWRLDGADIAGATSSSYTIPSVQAFHAGTYTVVITSGGVSTTSAGATVTVTPPPASGARPLNLSTRGLSLSGGEVLIPGFVIEGSGTKRLLIRAVGPTLGGYGITDALPDPQFVLMRYNPVTHADEAQLVNDNWGTNANAAEVASTAAAVGAFPLDAGSNDAAALVDLAPGRYTVVADGKGTSGLAMVELYDADTASSTARLVNISNRGFVGTGDNIMIPGFVVSDEGSRTFLIRAVGPGLSDYGVTGVLADPQIAIFKRRSDATTDELILSNNDWDNIAGSGTTSAVAAQVGAFPLGAGSKDAAFVVTLTPGVYTVHASGVGGSTGVALVEVYLVP